MRTSSIILCICGILLVSCASPESDGKQVALAYCNAANTSIEYCKAEYSRLIDNFESENFTTRVEVREIMQKIEDNAEQLKARKEAQAEKLYYEKSGKYATDYSKITAFQTAFNNTQREFKPLDEESMSVYTNKLNNLILTIIPPKPDINKIKRDLIGREIWGLEGSYFAGWSWEITAESLKDLYIIEDSDTTNKNGNRIYYVHLTISSASGTCYETDVKLYYRLGHADDWTLDMLENQNIEIVKTGMYDNSLTISKNSFSGYTITNVGDASLIAGFRVLYNNTWTKKTVVIHGGRSEVFYYNDLIMDFVERP